MMGRFLPDTSCIIAALCGWHGNHERAQREIQRRLEAGDSMVAAAPALVESYAVLTRLPPPHRLSPDASLSLLTAGFLNARAKVVALDGEAYRSLLTSGPQLGIAGGAVYDAVILACARMAAVDAVLTFNERQFRRLDLESIDICVPA